MFIVNQSEHVDQQTEDVSTWYVVEVVLDVDEVVVRRHWNERVAIVSATNRLRLCRNARVLADDVDVQITKTSLTRIH